MTGEDVRRDTEELRPRIDPLLEDGERLQVALRARATGFSSSPPTAAGWSSSPSASATPAR